MTYRKKRQLKRNDYRRHSGGCVTMPSGAFIYRNQNNGIRIRYEDWVRRWISNTYYDDVLTDQL